MGKQTLFREQSCVIAMSTEHQLYLGTYLIRVITLLSDRNSANSFAPMSLIWLSCKLYDNNYYLKYGVSFNINIYNKLGMRHRKYTYFTYSLSKEHCFTALIRLARAPSSRPFFSRLFKRRRKLTNYFCHGSKMLQ